MVHVMIMIYLVFFFRGLRLDAWGLERIGQTTPFDSRVYAKLVFFCECSLMK